MTILRSKADIELLVATFWTWSARNHFLFKGKRENPQVLIAKTEAVVDAYKRTQLQASAYVGSQQALFQQTWIPLQRGYFKVNVDAATNSEKQITGLGAVI